MQNMNCLLGPPDEDGCRTQRLPFKTIKIEQSNDSQRVALCGDQQSLFIFRWNCSDFGSGQSQLSALNDQIMSKRVEALVNSSSGS